MIDIVYKESESSAKEEAASLLKEKVAKVKIPTLLLLSGGSWQAVYDNVEVKKANNLWVMMLDERCYPDDKVNNYEIFSRTSLFSSARKCGGNILSTKVKNEDDGLSNARQVAQKMDGFIESFYSKNDSLPTKVIATMGMGKDGHTAGIFPVDGGKKTFNWLFSSEPRVVGYDAGEDHKYRYRATATLPFLRNNISTALVYAVGERKKSTLKKLFQNTPPIYKMPASIVHEMKKVMIITDQKGVNTK